ncbi:MAG: Co2+/Mg2+ efflux protein ApaG [Phaeospirillum sp.]|nr:Co2+/Mg2+ efflux protein ApaG [Phaeospirillum sp.]
MFQETTHGIRIRATPQFEAEQSDLEGGVFVFSYTIDIFNESNQTIQLISRKWVITDANGKTEEVQGPGVVGEQPVLEPGQNHSYTSFCPLATPIGSMHGTYQMVTREGASFDAVIPTFTLAFPNALN